MRVDIELFIIASAQSYSHNSILVATQIQDGDSLGAARDGIDRKDPERQG